MVCNDERWAGHLDATGLEPWPLHGLPTGLPGTGNAVGLWWPVVSAPAPCGRAAVGARRGRGSGVPEVRSRSRVATLSLLQGGGFWGGPGNPVAVSRLGAFHWGRKVVLAGITAAPPRGGTHAYPEPVATVRSLACHVSDGCCRYSAIPGPAAQPYPPLLSTWGHPLFRSGGQGVLVRTYSF